MQSSCNFLRVGQEAATGRDGARSATAAGGDSSVVPVGNHGDHLQTTHGAHGDAADAEVLLDALCAVLVSAMSQIDWDNATWYAVLLLEGKKAGAL